jgi:hypothetical protein
VTTILDRRSAASLSPPQLAFAGFALLLTGALAVVVYVVPLNANDFIQHLIHFEQYPFSHTFRRQFLEHRWLSSDWRPLQYTTSHALYLLAAKGHEHLVFKGLLAVCVGLTGWLLARLTPAPDWRAAFAAMTALMILYAHQSFAGAVEAVYPYGVEIILVIFELIVLGILIRGRPSRASGIAVVAMSLFAILLNEKGALVGVTYVAGALVGLPGASRRTAAAVFVSYVAVVAIRIAFYTGIAGMGQRASARSMSDMLFDLVAPALNVLISDPRFGKFRTFPQAFYWAQPWAIITVITSVTTLLLIVAWAARTFARNNVSTELRVAALLPVTLAASMLFGAFSQKDYIPIMALPVYALVAFYAMRWAFTRAFAPVALAIGIVLFAGWGVRTAGLFYYMHRMAYDYQEEWVDGERHARFNQYDRSIGMPILERLRAQATASPVTYPDYLMPGWLVAYLRGRGCPEFCGRFD